MFWSWLLLAIQWFPPGHLLPGRFGTWGTWQPTGLLGIASTPRHRISVDQDCNFLTQFKSSFVLLKSANKYILYQCTYMNTSWSIEYRLTIYDVCTWNAWFWCSEPFMNDRYLEKYPKTLEKSDATTATGLAAAPSRAPAVFRRSQPWSQLSTSMT